ncbi:hypothetical protein [Salicibibacter halophilus]|uniref:hypothetical protein n=1 Tax=Salicibibacter halophilus TaxID=2502791 RepID=UPI00135C9930|nr:hypothetical protein [Salicibibacter halophilus]
MMMYQTSVFTNFGISLLGLRRFFQPSIIDHDLSAVFSEGKYVRSRFQQREKARKNLTKEHDEAKLKAACLQWKQCGFLRLKHYLTFLSFPVRPSQKIHLS